MTTTRQDKDTKDEGLKFRKDGKIECRTAEDLHILRRPKFGEYRRIKDMVTEQGVAITEMAEAAGVSVTGITTAMLTNPDVVAIVDKSQQTSADVVDEIFKMLCSNPLPEDRDEWPTWLVTGQNVLTTMLNHWQVAPLDLG